MFIAMPKSVEINSVHDYHNSMRVSKLEDRIENPLPKKWNRCNHFNVSMAGGLAFPVYRDNYRLKPPKYVA
jgi:hypothetical protein